jgi:hypothetical protein
MKTSVELLLLVEPVLTMAILNVGQKRSTVAKNVDTACERVGNSSESALALRAVAIKGCGQSARQP